MLIIYWIYLFLSFFVVFLSFDALKFEFLNSFQSVFFDRYIIYPVIDISIIRVRLIACQNIGNWTLTINYVHSEVTLYLYNLNIKVLKFQLIHNYVCIIESNFSWKWDSIKTTSLLRVERIMIIDSIQIYCWIASICNWHHGNIYTKLNRSESKYMYILRY